MTYAASLFYVLWSDVTMGFNIFIRFESCFDIKLYAGYINLE